MWKFLQEFIDTPFKINSKRFRDMKNVDIRKMIKAGKAKPTYKIK